MLLQVGRGNPRWNAASTIASEQGCGIKGFIPTSVIHGYPLFIWGVGLWEALFVVSQKWIPFPTALLLNVLGLRHSLPAPAWIAPISLRERAGSRSVSCAGWSYPSSTEARALSFFCSPR